MMAQTPDNCAPDEYGANVNDWIRFVRRCRLGRTTKAVAFALATYADSNGRRIFPGVAGLAVACEVTYNVAQESLSALRDAGLIERITYGTRRMGKADEYRLILHPDVLERITVLDPNQVEKEVERLMVRRRGGRDPKPRLHPTACGAEPPSDEGFAPHGDVPTEGFAPHGVDVLHPTPLPPTLHYLSTSTTLHCGNDLRATVTRVRARGPNRNSIPWLRLVHSEIRSAA